MAVTPVNQTLTVATAGTRVQVTTDTTIQPTSVYFEALRTNTGDIYVGVSDVSGTKYSARLTAGQSWGLSSDHIGGSASGRGSVAIQLSSLWIDCSVSGEKAQLTYMNAG